MRHFSIQRDGLDRAMRSQQNATSWRLVAAAGLHPHVAVFNDIGATNAVSPAPLIELRQYLGSSQYLTVDRHHVAVLKGQDQFLRLIGRGFRAHRPAPHVFLGRDPGVFQHIALVGDMQQVGVHGVRGFLLCLGKIHRDIVLLTIGHERLTGVQVPLSPRRNHLNTGFQGIGAQLKAHLIVPFTGCTVGDGVGTGLVGNLDQSLRD